MTTTSAHFIQTFNAIIAAHPIYGAQFTGLDAADRINKVSRLLGREFHSQVSLYFRWEQAWGISASLDVAVDLSDIVENLRTVTVECSVSAPSTGRSIAQALAFSTLHRQVTELGALIEARLNSVRIESEEPADVTSP